MEPLLRAVHVKRVFGRGPSGITVLSDTNLTVMPGRLVVLKGKSGSGKTTLLNLLAALDRPTDGEIYFQGRLISQLPEKERTKIRQRQMGLIFQSFGLVPLMSAFENVEFGLRISGVPRKQQKPLAEKALEMVGLQSRMHHHPPELSGGEQQRVAIARAIAHRPVLVLADEPTAELDSRTGLQMIKIFQDLVGQGMTVVMSSHDPSIDEVVDQVFELEDGKIVHSF